ncbi:MAG: fatty acid--CoA ligase family protein [Bacteroidales bacterium]
MYLDYFFTQFEKNSEKTAIIWRDQFFSYQWLIDKTAEAKKYLQENSILPGQIVALRADFNPYSIAFFLALVDNNNILVPISYSVKTIDEFYEIAEVQAEISFTGKDFTLRKIENQVSHSLLTGLIDKNRPGLIVFSSGSTGKSKAAVHDFVPLLEKFKVSRMTLKTLTFLLFDHLGGINTMFYILSNSGTIVTPLDRSPDSICDAIEKYKVELLPTSPSFINYLLMTRVYEKYDISSLKMVSYGTEAMPEATLKRFNALYPSITLRQTYGLSELGVMRTKSKSNDSLWVKVGGEDYATKIVNDILYIKAKTAMLGYLNAPSPFDEEGWFNTQDKVIVDGDWIKILGRETDIINVGGQKVYPAEVESALLEMDNIEDAYVAGKSNPILGNIVVAKILLNQDEPVSDLKRRIRSYCSSRLEGYKIPMEIEIIQKHNISDRFKKIR